MSFRHKINNNMAAETTNTYPMTPPTQSIFTPSPFTGKKPNEPVEIPGGKKMEIEPMETTNKGSSE